MTQQALQEVFIDQIRDLYDAEKQLVKVLPKIAKAATTDELSQAVNDHLEQTRNHVTRLEQVFQSVGAPAKSKPCKGMRGLLEEGSDVMGEHEGIALDLSIIAAAQRVEHYEISAYGTARTLAERIGNTKAAQLLGQTEEEEKEADIALTDVAETIYASSQTDGEAENGGEEMDMAAYGKNSSPSKKRSR